MPQAVEKALAFYAEAFGAKEIFRAPGAAGRIVHGQMRIGDSLVFLAEEQPSDPDSYHAPSTLRGIYMYVGDCDAVLRQAVDAGASVLCKVQARPWGDRDGLVRDPFGHLWGIASRVAS
jgi:PhnB protein